jgi:hypothetical protein
MMEQEEQDNNRSAFVYNSEDKQVPTIVQLRLSVTEILQTIEYFLRGYRFVTKRDEAGNIVEIPEQFGKPKANEEGIQNILLRITSIINPAVVQSNFDVDDLDTYLSNVEISIGRMIMVNCYEWQISDKQQDIIVDFIMDFVEPFMRRTIDNQERILLGASTKIVERSGEQGKESTNWFKRL